MALEAVRSAQINDVVVAKFAEPKKNKRWACSKGEQDRR